MGKMYTLDNKLLIGSPEIRIGDKVYPVDDRQKTVKKLMKMQNEKRNSDKKCEKTAGEEHKEPNDKKVSNNEDMDEIMDETFKLAFGDKAAKEIDNMNIPFAAYQQLFELVVSAMTGEEPEEVEARFQKSKQKAVEQQPVV